MRRYMTLAAALTLAIALTTIEPAFAGEPHEHEHGRAAEHHQAVKDRVTPVSTMRQLVDRQRAFEVVTRAVEDHDVARAAEHKATDAGANPGAVSEKKQ